MPEFAKLVSFLQDTHHWITMFSCDKRFQRVLFFLLGPLCYKLITIVNCYLEAGLTCFVYCPKALYLIIFIVWHPF